VPTDTDSRERQLRLLVAQMPIMLWRRPAIADHLELGSGFQLSRIESGKLWEDDTSFCGAPNPDRASDAAL